LIPQAKPVLYILLIFTTAACSQTSLCQQDITTTLDMQEMTTYILAMEMFSTDTLVVQMTATTPDITTTLDMQEMTTYILAMEMFSTTTLVVQMTATTPLTMSLVSMLCLCLAMPLYAVL